MPLLDHFHPPLHMTTQPSQYAISCSRYSLLNS
jgi:hypothetical protein